MATFGQLARGTRARKRIPLPLLGASFNVEQNRFEGNVAELDIRPLTPTERSEVLAKARAFAIDRGLEDPKEGDPLYEQGLMLHTLVLACVDKDSPEDAPKPFFDGGFEQLFTTEALSDDHIAYLYEQVQLWEDEVSPRVRTLSEAEFLAGIITSAGGDMTFFASARPGIRWSCFRSLAAQHMISLTRKSSSGSTSPESGTP